MTKPLFRRTNYDAPLCVNTCGVYWGRRLYVRDGKAWVPIGWVCARCGRPTVDDTGALQKRFGAPPISRTVDDNAIALTSTEAGVTA